MDLELIKNLVLDVLSFDDSYYLYDINQIREYGEDILQILIDKKDGINIDELAIINEKISEKLDHINIDLDKYLLEVSSPGAEKELRNLEEVKESINKYVYIETNDLKYEGMLVDLIDDTLVVRCNLKGRFKNFNIKYADVKFIRLAVKI